MIISEIKEALKEEKDFLDKLAGPDFEIRPETNLSLLIKVYNEQLEALVRARVDANIFSNLIICEPAVKEHLDSKAKADVSVTRRKEIVNVLRDQIVDFIKEGKNVK